MALTCSMLDILVSLAHGFPNRFEALPVELIVESTYI